MDSSSKSMVLLAPFWANIGVPLFDSIAPILETSQDPFSGAGRDSNLADSRYLFALGGPGSTIYRILHQETMFRSPTELACWAVVLTNFA